MLIYLLLFHLALVGYESCFWIFCSQLRKFFLHLKKAIYTRLPSEDPWCIPWSTKNHFSRKKTWARTGNFHFNEKNIHTHMRTTGWKFLFNKLYCFVNAVEACNVYFYYNLWHVSIRICFYLPFFSLLCSFFSLSRHNPHRLCNVLTFYCNFNLICDKVPPFNCKSRNISKNIFKIWSTWLQW